MCVMGIRRTTSAPPLLGRFSRHCAVNEVRGGAWHARTPAQWGGSPGAGWIGRGPAARSTWLHALHVALHVTPPLVALVNE